MYQLEMQFSTINISTTDLLLRLSRLRYNSCTIFTFFLPYMLCFILKAFFLFSNPSKQLNFIIILHTTCALEEINNLMRSTTSSFLFLFLFFMVMISLMSLNCIFV